MARCTLGPLPPFRALTFYLLPLLGDPISSVHCLHSSRNFAALERALEQATYALNGVILPAPGFARSIKTRESVCPCDQ